jgi:hypothetical protein
MTLRYELDQDVDTVHAKLSDPEFLADRLEAIGEDRPEVEVQVNGDKTTFKLKRAARRDLPKVAAKIIGEVQRFDMTETWAPEGAGWRGEYHIDVVGAPVSIDATFDLFPADGGSIYTIDHHPKAKVPLVGKTLEKFLLKQTRAGCIDELDYLKQTLS